MKKERTATVLLWGKTSPKKTGFLITIRLENRVFKHSIMAIRREDQIDECPSRRIEVDTGLIKDLEVYYGTHGGATMSGDLAKAVEKLLYERKVIA